MQDPFPQVPPQKHLVPPSPSAAASDEGINDLEWKLCSSAAENAACTESQLTSKKRRGTQARSACVICARGKRKCEGGRPCDRCRRVDKADACLAGIPYEQGICRKRRRPQQTESLPENASRSKVAPRAERRNSVDDQGHPKTYHCDFKFLNCSGGVSAVHGDSVCSSRLCSMVNHEKVFNANFASFRCIAPGSKCIKGNFQLCTSGMSLLGCLAAEEWDKNVQQRTDNIQVDGAWRGTDIIESTSSFGSRWSSIIPVGASFARFQLCRPGELCRYSSESFRPTSSNEVSKERLCMEALASLIAGGFGLGDIEKMAVASLCSNWGSGTKTESCQEEHKNSPRNTGDDLSALDGMLMLGGQSSAVAAYSAGSYRGTKSEHETSTVTLHEASSVGGGDPQETELGLSQYSLHNSSSHSLWKLPFKRRENTGMNHLLRLAKRVALDCYMEIPTVPLDSVTLALDNFPTSASRLLSKLAKRYCKEMETETVAKLKSPELVEALANWYNNIAEEQISIGVAGLALEKLLRSMFNTPHSERIPMYDELMGIINYQFPHPLTHIENDVDEGVANRIWINDAMLELLNVEPKGIAAACGMKVGSQGHGGVKLVRGHIEDDTAVNHWMHPEILLPRAMAMTQAQLLKCSLLTFKGKYLRNVEHQERCSGAQPYTVFQAREILHCVRHADGPLLSITQTFANPEMDSSATLEESMLPQGGRMMRKMLNANHRSE
eukprot:gb/GECG01009921.1/.p1 GENE.gb/GECG01009921.1/~~gb/GECG01009921.1/.p1  ORF type:complete len:724 (+),score=78.08 gb/GECG01009921.1/:1-2172(+)